jgi:cytochrome c-type biogenesis protein
LGLNIIFDFISFLNYEKRPFFKGHPKGQTLSKSGFRSTQKALPGAFLAGAAFAAGWTPCIGPILTGILLMASQSGKTGIAVLYLAVYSAGLGLPFFLTSLFFDSFLKHASRLRPHLPLIRRISGILLIVIGIIILSGRYSALSELIQRLVFSYIDWAETQALPFRLLAKALAWIQSF